MIAVHPVLVTDKTFCGRLSRDAVGREDMRREIKSLGDTLHEWGVSDELDGLQELKCGWLARQV